MLHYQLRNAGPDWQNENDVFGTFDWRKTRLHHADRRGRHRRGTQPGPAGQLRNRVVRRCCRSRFSKHPSSAPSPPANPPPAFKGHDLPRLRGVMSPNEFRDEDLRVLGKEWKANVIRWQITRNWGNAGTDRDLAEYDRWLDAELDDLDKALEACRDYGIKVVIDMHSPPGGRYANNDLAIFNEPVYQDHWVALWEKMARRYKGHPAVWGYDLINEPVQNKPSPAGRGRLPRMHRSGPQRRSARSIPTRRSSSRPPNGIRPPVSRISNPSMCRMSSIRSTCMSPASSPTRASIGELENRHLSGKNRRLTDWDKQQLRATLQPVRDFQLAYNVHIYAGEFSAIRWAPGAAEYLGDCIDIFEEYGWDWTYHAYREWDGWSVEHGTDPNDHQPSKRADRPQATAPGMVRQEPAAVGMIGRMNFTLGTPCHEAMVPSEHHEHTDHTHFPD